MRRTWRAPVALGAAIALLLAGCSTDKSDKPKNNGSVEITKDGGSFPVGGLTINVAPQTVQANTKLTVSTPTVQKGSTPRPLGSANSTNVQFDISLAGGAQPLEPLDVQIPLQGAFLPAGAKPENARIYTPTTTVGWRLVPSIVKGNVLHAKLSHLSPKNISFASPGELWDSIASQWEPQEVKNCNRELTTGATGKVKLGGDGWKNDTSSVLHPCLMEENGKTMLRVGNNTGLMWSVASSGANINAPDSSAEAGIVKLIVKTLTPNNKVKAYLAEGDATWTNVTKDDLPATLEFRADPNTFLAQAFWVGLNMAVGMFTGTNGSQAVAHVKTFLTAVDGLDCLKKAAETANGSTDTKKIIDILLSSCTEVIATILGVDVKSKGAADWVLGGLIAAFDGIKDSLGLLGTAFQGVMQQVNGNITVKVMKVSPPCATRKDFNSASSRTRGVSVTGEVKNIKCVNGWAHGNELAGPGLDGVLVVVRLEGDRWKEVFVGTAPPEHGYDGFCDARTTPKKIRDLCVG